MVPRVGESDEKREPMSNAKYKQEPPPLQHQLFTVLAHARSVWARRDLHLAGCAFAAAPDNAAKEKALTQAFEDFIGALCAFDLASVEVFSALAMMPPSQDMSLGAIEGPAQRDWRAAFRAFRTATMSLLALLRAQKPILLSIGRQADGTDPLAKAFREKCGELAASLA